MLVRIECHECGEFVSCWTTRISKDMVQRTHAPHKTHSSPLAHWDMHNWCAAFSAHAAHVDAIYMDFTQRTFTSKGRSISNWPNFCRASIPCWMTSTTNHQKSQNIRAVLFLDKYLSWRGKSLKKIFGTSRLLVVYV